MKTTPEELRAKCRNAHPVDAAIIMQAADEIERLRACLIETIHALKKYGYGIQPMAADDISRWRKAAGLEET
jgi:hypothetical protein